MTTVCIHQPDFAPWLGFFERLLHTDVFVILDDVQYLRRGWHHRDQIKTAQGVQWITVPVIKKGRYDQLINQTEVDDSQGWRPKHLRTLESAYKRAPHFQSLFDRLSADYAAGDRMLGDFNIRIIRTMMSVFGIEVPVVLSSSLGVTSSSTARLVDIVRRVGGTTYLSGLGAKAYLDVGMFADNGLDLLWQRFEHPVYSQLHGEFAKGLSGLDCLFNCGAGAATVLTSGSRKPERDA